MALCREPEWKEWRVVRKVRAGGRQAQKCLFRSLHVHHLSRSSRLQDTLLRLCICGSTPITSQHPPSATSIPTQCPRYIHTKILKRHEACPASRTKRSQAGRTVADLSADCSGNKDPDIVPLSVFPVCQIALLPDKRPFGIV